MNFDVSIIGTILVVLLRIMSGVWRYLLRIYECVEPLDGRWNSDREKRDDHNKKCECVHIVFIIHVLSMVRIIRTNVRLGSTCCSRSPAHVMRTCTDVRGYRIICVYLHSADRR